MLSAQKESTFSDPIQAFRMDSLDSVDCVICSEVYVEPWLTPCGHTFCKECLLGLYRYHESAAPPCPMCRSPLPDISYCKPIKALGEANRKIYEANRTIRELRKVKPGLTNVEIPYLTMTFLSKETDAEIGIPLARALSPPYMPESLPGSPLR